MTLLLSRACRRLGSAPITIIDGVRALRFGDFGSGAVTPRKEQENNGKRFKRSWSEGWSRWVLVGMPSGRDRTGQDRPLKATRENWTALQDLGQYCTGNFLENSEACPVSLKSGQKSALLSDSTRHTVFTECSFTERLETREKSQN